MGGDQTLMMLKECGNGDILGKGKLSNLYLESSDN